MKVDVLYQDYLDNHKSYVSDFDRFCIEHCQDIRNILEENEELKKQQEEFIKYLNVEEKMNKYKCKKCGNPINEVVINIFDCDGSDYSQSIPFKQVPNNAIYFDTTINWTGYELTDSERKEDIVCPFCKKYPFDDDIEIQTYEIVRVVCFKK